MHSPLKWQSREVDLFSRIMFERRTPTCIGATRLSLADSTSGEDCSHTHKILVQVLANCISTSQRSMVGQNEAVCRNAMTQSSRT